MIKLYFWLRKSIIANQSTVVVGHVSLETFSGDCDEEIKKKEGDGIYVSFWPKNVCKPENCNQFHRDHFHSFEEDKVAESEEPTHTEYLFGLDLAKIHREYVNFRSDRSEPKWALLASSALSDFQSKNCVRLIYDLLVAGGIYQYFPVRKSLLISFISGFLLYIPMFCIEFLHQISTGSNAEDEIMREILANQPIYARLLYVFAAAMPGATGRGLSCAISRYISTNLFIKPFTSSNLTLFFQDIGFRILYYFAFVRYIKEPYQLKYINGNLNGYSKALVVSLPLVYLLSFYMNFNFETELASMWFFMQPIEYVLNSSNEKTTFSLELLSIMINQMSHYFATSLTLSHFSFEALLYTPNNLHAFVADIKETQKLRVIKKDNSPIFENNYKGLFFKNSLKSKLFAFNGVIANNSTLNSLYLSYFFYNMYKSRDKFKSEKNMSHTYTKYSILCILGITATLWFAKSYSQGGATVLTDVINDSLPQLSK